AKERAGELQERFGLASHADRPVKDWSGGMRRRLDVALALVHSPSILFLDEPTTGLDPEVRSELWADISLLRGEGVTVLLTTHYLEEADQLADQIAIIDGGKVVASGSPSDLKDAMEGDGLQIELASSEDSAPALETLAESGLVDLTTDGCGIRGRVSRGPEAVPRVLGAMSAAGIGVRAVTVTRPSLDDVFLAHTGRSFAPSDQEVSS
ncbi:MAG TPA: ATP-binding cassette domain-containing protein, partial [Acidimicrobiia bacterium]|nr:ATP-binding cassette domain-containing protein [Acidimicrobiia bacterium]